MVGADGGEKVGGRVEGADAFVVCPDGFETGFIEDGVGFAEAVIVFVDWGARVLGG